ncbi:MAG: hypothetical protein LKM37_09210 [Bacteroidales bacterium]|jgi:hypothetical protein|nr:hypothetical protein [Bacteroidales bacterium]MCI1733484.1 hypothetical protein [Bacteroidales bacterium]
MNKRFQSYILVIILVAWIAADCSGIHRRIGRLEKSGAAANVAIDNGGQHINVINPDSLVIEASMDSGEPLIMNAVKEDSTGDMIAADNLKPIVVQARFRNVAERNGMVSIAFQITVPEAMQDPFWQVRFFPKLFWNSDSLRLDKIYITGKNYRDEQLKGYEKYKRFYNSIIPDSSDYVSAFTREALLRRFAERNFNGKNNCDVTEDEAVEYYTKYWLVNLNNRRKSRLGEMYKKYVKDPIEKEGIRLDTIIMGVNGDILYRYIQTLRAQKDMRKVKLSFDGGVYADGKELYKMPSCDSLTFYVSSIVQFADRNPFYLSKVVERRVNVNTLAFIDFRAGKWNIEDTLFNNEEEIKRIKGNFDTLVANNDYVIDSIVVTASCSPEGSFMQNAILAGKRAASIKKYFYNYLNDGKLHENPVMCSHSIPEDWKRLEVIIRADSFLIDKPDVLKCFEISNPDIRERALSKTKDYSYLRAHVYPLLRRINFSFCLHRRGMIKDTVHTLVVDSVYMKGVEALEERDYKTAINILRPYRTLNTAVAYMCLNYNHSALDILENLKVSAQRNYMMAVLYGRLGDEKEAVKYFLSSVQMEPQMKYRGNLDPEISSLISKYRLLE